MTLKASKSGYVSVNGIDLYHEIYGDGQPLVLLHGGLGVIQMFEPILPALAAKFQVIGVDLQAHGRTADINRPMSFEAMADDVAGLIKHLRYEQVNVLGYSLGGGVTQQIAIRHPELVRKLIVISCPCKFDGWYPEVQAGFANVNSDASKAMQESPVYQLYSQLAPRPEDWPVLLDKLGALVQQDFDWRDDIAALKMPVLIIVGDADSIHLNHAVEFFGLLGGGKGDAGWDGSGFKSDSQLAILPNATHYNILMSPVLVASVVSFLDADTLSNNEEHSQ